MAGKPVVNALGGEMIGGIALATAHYEPDDKIENGPLTGNGP
jgi:hypothetical protein